MEHSKTTFYYLGQRVLLNTSYQGDYNREDGYSVGTISEVVTPGRHYSIALDGYYNRFVDFGISEFKPLVCWSLLDMNAPVSPAERLESRTEARRNGCIGSGFVVCHDRRIGFMTNGART
jgi:hypothetical protein